jgi:hypothetical protein
VPPWLFDCVRNQSPLYVFDTFAKGGALKKLEEYLEHAAECRDMARTSSSPTHKTQLENMAATWEQLAEARKKKLLARGLTEDDGRDLDQ